MNRNSSSAVTRLPEVPENISAQSWSAITKQSKKKERDVSSLPEKWGLGSRKRHCRSYTKSSRQNDDQTVHSPICPQSRAENGCRGLRREKCANAPGSTRCSCARSSSRSGRGMESCANRCFLDCVRIRRPRRWCAKASLVRQKLLVSRGLRGKIRRSRPWQLFQSPQRGCSFGGSRDLFRVLARQLVLLAGK